ncbi:hypothetical protein BJF85_16690 [Saccharomonospora sp. CUA-673]|uniref:DUF6214 family protein n=1 Tax=Saccharomonospora sp. CUA-673 TaxID=1904969 RepID=UPI000959781E|nr:DUF6214 family protein [Saccharomonospora sp. CUA-673]OLT46481.1 hypothetical protein BJF85_16690 [Saccharomonospora sp. CUA-673]
MKHDLDEIADVYRAAVERTEHPRRAVMNAFGMTRQTAARWIRLAREAGNLPPEQGKAFAAGEHYPRRARFGSDRATWLACAECRHPWPCPNRGGRNQ